MRIILELSVAELHNLLWSDSAKIIGEKYKISQKKILRIAKENAIPIADSKYWQNKNNGKDVEIIELPIHVNPDEILIIDKYEKIIEEKEKKRLRRIWKRYEKHGF